MNGKLTFGYLYDFRNPPQWHRPAEALYAETLDFATWTESVGFTGAWVPEHHLAEDGYMPSPLVTLAAIAARTKTIRLGTAVALAPLYHPVRFAQDCAVLDILSGGRLDLALAIGYRRRETAAFGVEFGKRGRQFDEFLEIVTRLWAGETVDYAGQFFSFTGAKLMPPAPRGRVPLYIGGFVAKAMERVAQYADGYFGNVEAVPAYLEALAAAGKELSAAKVRVPELFTLVARDPEAAMTELAPHFHHVNNSYGLWAAEDQALGVDTMRALGAMSLEDFKASGILRIYTPEQAIELFKGMATKMPVEHIMMGLPPGLPPAKFQPYAELFAKEVIPAFG